MWRCHGRVRERPLLQIPTVVMECCVAGDMDRLLDDGRPIVNLNQALGNLNGHIVSYHSLQVAVGAGNDLLQL